MRTKPFLLLLPLAILTAQTPADWTPELSLQVKPIGDVVPSPDGKLAAWTETRAILDAERSEQVTQIWLGRADGSWRIQLTRGEKSSTSPAFSPDGRWVYFSSARSGKGQLYRIAVEGGEAEPLTDWKGDLGQSRVSPDGKWVAFAAREEDKDEEKLKKEKRDFRVVDEAPKNHGLWLIPAEADAGSKRAPKRLVEPTRHIVGLAWSPDSRAIAYTHQKTPIANDWPSSDVSEVEVETAKSRVVAATEASESGALYSPDGRHIAYELSGIPARWPGQERIALAPRQGGAVRLLPATFDEGPNLVGWSPDSSKLLFTEARHTRVAVYQVPVDGPAAPLYQRSRGTIGFAIRMNTAGTHVGISQESPEEAPEAYVLRVGEIRPVQVSRANVDLLKPPIGRTEAIRWKAPDGMEVEGLLTYPAGYESGRKYPLILIIHGGPAGVFSESYIGRYGIYPIAGFSSRGYAVLRANPRGSSGYGMKFRFANVNDWGGGDYRDLMAGVDRAIAMGVADPDRMAVMGWSYGGFMTSWVITQTKRFKAAVIGAAVTNLWSFTGTADIAGFLPDYFTGEPWENFENYRTHSPMSFVGQVSTPALILHGENDLRVPISQGYEYYNALKRRGVTAKMVTYPRMPHGPTEPKFIQDIMQRHLDWVDKYVR